MPGDPELGELDPGSKPGQPVASCPWKLLFKAHGYQESWKRGFCSPWGAWPQTPSFGNSLEDVKSLCHASASEAELDPFIQFNGPDTNLTYTLSPVLSISPKMSFVYLTADGMPAIWSSLKQNRQTVWDMGRTNSTLVDGHSWTRVQQVSPTLPAA